MDHDFGKGIRAHNILAKAKLFLQSINLHLKLEAIDATEAGGIEGRIWEEGKVC
jgi:hypothetical protein